MATDVLREQEHLEGQVTRRRVVSTGVKLAYAAPLVAASFKTSGLIASAQDVTGVGCPGGRCLQAPRCGESRFCRCYDNPSGGGFCHKCEKCQTVPNCSNQADCDALGNGSICSGPGVHCCGNRSVCLQPCDPNILSNCVNPPQAEVRVYDVAAVDTDYDGGNCDQTICW